MTQASEFTLLTPIPPEAIPIMGLWALDGTQNAFDDETRPISLGEFANRFRQAERNGIFAIAVLNGGGLLAGTIFAKEISREVVEIGLLAPHLGIDGLLPAVRTFLTGLFELGVARVQVQYRADDRVFLGFIEKLGGTPGEVIGSKLFAGRMVSTALAWIDRQAFEKANVDAAPVRIV